MFFLASRVEDPSTGFGFYVLMSFVYVSYYFVVTIHLGYITKLFPKDIRGISTGLSGFLSLAGVFAYVVYSGWLKNSGAEWPLIGVSIADLAGCVLFILLALFGIFGPLS